MLAQEERLQNQLHSKKQKNYQDYGNMNNGNQGYGKGNKSDDPKGKNKGAKGKGDRKGGRPY